jgi:Tfp pilus assembly protein FimT
VAEGRRARGAALLDVIFTCGLIAILASIAIPSLQASRDRDAALLAARHLASRLHLLRVEAIRRNRAVALRFDPEDLGRTRAYVDGDGDGVREQDVADGTDLALEPAAHIADTFASVRFHVAAAVPTPDGQEVIAAGADPIRIGNSNFVSFSAIGTCTSGTIYLAGNAGAQVAVRLLGATGRLRVLRFDQVGQTWRVD